jgi:uncharacterized caspase-like protein
MSTVRPIWIAALYAFVLLVCSISDAKADRRVALVVGNSHYSNASLFLANPKNDAEDVAAALRGIGFEVLQAIDANKRDLDLNMAKFARLATDADAALFYYAGHAVQYQGRNFLMPTDAEVEDEISFRYQMTPLDDVRAALDRGDGVKIVILDACRNNPIVNALRRKKKSGDSRSVDAVRGGLAKIDKAQGMVVAYSTAADEVAADGDGRNSPFTSAFLKRLKEPGLEVEQLFRRVAADVNAQTGGRQRPETYVSLLSNYYLNQTDRIAFDKVKDSPDSAPLQDFIAKFPTSSFVPEAQGRIQKIEAVIRERQQQLARQQEAARVAEEQRKAEREAALRKLAEQEEALRKQETQRAQAAAEKVRKEREAAQAQEEQRLRLVAEKERKDREAAKEAAKAQEEQRVKLAAERERAQREEAQRVLAEQQRTKVASVDRKEPVNPSLAGLSSDIRNVPPTQAAPASADPCERDSAMLAHLRSNPSLEAVVAFERGLTCEKLRPQALRLQESLSSVANAAPVTAVVPARPTIAVAPPVAVVVPPPPAPPPAPKQEAAPKPPADPPKVAVATVEPGPACKQDEARLSKIRANPSLAELAALERELGCERLRPQIVRLRESLPKVDQPAVANAATPDRVSPPVEAVERPADVKQAQAPAPASPVAQVRSCDEERAILARLRASQSREDVVKFERELACEQLRPQVIRLKESLSGG